MDSHKTESFNNQNIFPKCSPCKIDFISNGNSNRRDLVLMSATSRFNRIDILVRSLRTVGCNARIVVLIPLGMKNDIQASLVNCGVEFVEMTSLSSRVLRSPHKVRWEWYYEYLLEHISEFDRILHTDAFDAFAQIDPFDESISKDTFYAIGEGKKIKDCVFNSNWIDSCFKNNENINKSLLENVKEKEVFCSGTVISGAKPFFEFVRMMVRSPFWDDCWSRAQDQGFFNFVLYTEAISKLKVVLLSCKSQFLTMGSCSMKQRIFFYKNNLLKPGINGRYPSFVHQYNRFPSVDKRIQEMCGVTISRRLEKKNAKNESISLLKR